MQKIKLHSGLASLMLVASIFGGWQVVLITSLLILLFADVDDNVKNIATRVITFMIGYTIVTVFWNIICSGVGVVTTGINSLEGLINNFKDYSDAVSFAKLTNVIDCIYAVAKSVVDLLFTIVKVGFVIAVLTCKPSKGNFITNKINEYVSKATNYVASFNNNNNNGQQQ